MRFCIVGAGSIGGFVGARLALAGEEVTFIARGANLAAIRDGGLRLIESDGREEVAASAKATDRFEAAGRFDVVIVATKVNQFGAVAPRIAPLLDAGSVVLPLQNGLPFWYFHDHGGTFAGRTLESVDPGGAIKTAIPVERVIGCLVFCAAERLAPGVVKHVEARRFPMGELHGRTTERIERIAAAFGRAGLEAPVVGDIRTQAWVKLWGNLAFSPISALTRATLIDICNDPGGRKLATQMMSEAQAVAEKLGVRFPMTIEERLEAAARVGAHKSSMLQDVEAGRPLEVDALVGVVVELGELVGVPTPTIAAVYRATKLLDRTLRAV